MKTYNLGAGHLHYRRAGEDCFCALGIYAKEKGYSVEEIDLKRYMIFEDLKHFKDIQKMAEILTSGETGDAITAVFCANDDYDSARAAYTTPPEKIKEALSAVGINVELNDRRMGRPNDG